MVQIIRLVAGSDGGSRPKAVIPLSISVGWCKNRSLPSQKHSKPTDGAGRRALLYFRRTRDEDWDFGE
jgi:hypothetical protein